MDHDNIQTVIDIAQMAATPKRFDVSDPSIRQAAIPLVAVPTGDGRVELKSLKPLLDEWRSAPERRAGTSKAATLATLVELTNRHKDDDSVMFASFDGPSPSITAVIDYHKVDKSPRYGKHRISYAFPLSPEWLAWKKADGGVMGQEEFARFIEDHIAELSSPTDQEVSTLGAMFQTTFATPAGLMQLSRGLTLTIESKVSDFRTLSSGEVQVSYSEVHKDGAGEKLTVPGLFVVNIPVFVGSAPTRFVARLRYKKKDSGVVWFFQFYRADAVVRDAMVSDAEAVQAATSLPLYEGSPEA